jgi:hypothetical protein
MGPSRVQRQSGVAAVVEVLSSLIEFLEGIVVEVFCVDRSCRFRVVDKILAQWRSPRANPDKAREGVGLAENPSQAKGEVRKYGERTGNLSMSHCPTRHGSDRRRRVASILSRYL